MITTKDFGYIPSESEAETASNSYLMSLVALIAGMPLPIINLIATLIFFLSNRKSRPYARWHCTQALVSQLFIFVVNSIGFWWTISIILSNQRITSSYIAYIGTAFMFNLFEFVLTIYTAIQTRKGKHIEWWFYGNLTNLIYKAKV